MNSKNNYTTINYDFKQNINHFYENINKKLTDEINFKLEKEDLDRLKENSKKLNAFYRNAEMSPIQKYARVAEKIYTNPKQYGANSVEEILILFMFSVDPTFKALCIYNSESKVDDIRNKFKAHFGLFDNNLIKIERAFFKQYFHSKNKENNDSNKKVL